VTRALVLLLTVFTGLAGLVYEVVWQKYLATLLGSHSEATATILGIFLGGLSLGYRLFGEVTRRRVLRVQRAGRDAGLLRLYAAIEAGIGAWALLFPGLFDAVHALSARFGVASDLAAFAIDLGWTVLLVGPPAVLMGATVPVLTQALSRSVGEATRVHAWVYGLNTAGAFAGALLAGGWLVPWLGLRGAVWAMAPVNLGAAALLLALPGGPQGEGAAAPAPEPPAPHALFLRHAAAALLVGFALMTLQTAVIRIGAVSLGSSDLTFSLVVALFVLCIAAGSLGVSALPRVPRWQLPASLWAIALALGLLYFWLPEAPFRAHVVRTRFGTDDSDFHPYFAASFGWALAVLGPVLALSGSALPLLFHALRRELGGLGGTAGRLYSWNTLGSLLGALLGGYALLFWIDLHAVYRLAVAGVAVAAALVSPGPRLSFGLAALGALALLPAWDPRPLSVSLFRERRANALTEAGFAAWVESHWKGNQLLFYRDDPISTIAVVQFSHGRGRSLFVNGKSDGNSRGDYPTMGLTALVPALFSERLERAFVVGWGLGVTAGELSHLESIREVVVAEISPAVLEAAPLFDPFRVAEANAHKVTRIRSDAYRALLRSRGDFDVISSEPSNVWVSGVEMLYTREFLEAARDRLRPGGVYAQWFHRYEIDDEVLALVLRTYAAVFEEVAIWRTERTDLLLLGFRDPQAARDLSRVESRVQRPDFQAGLSRCGILGVPALLVHEEWPAGALRHLDLAGPQHTLYHPRLHHRAVRAFFRGETTDLPRISPETSADLEQASLLAQFLSRWAGRPPELVLEQMAREACTQHLPGCGATLKMWESFAPESPRLREVREAERSLRATPRK
jgi:spermidine synthase